MIAPRGQYASPIRSALVLSHGKLPTTDIYVTPRLRELPLDTQYVDTASECPRPELLAEGTFVIIVRYAPRSWLEYLLDKRMRLAGVALLLDDDIPGVLHSTNLPWRYAVKTAFRYAITKRLLVRLCDTVWVSTPYLQQKYPEVCTRLLEPLCIKGHPEVDTGHLTYFYHGTASHRCEMVWLVEVVRAVQSKVENAQFEIVGDAWVRRRFRNIPRVRVLHPMAWPDFLAYTSSVRHAVGLAPMLNTHFNRARSHNKLYDITRCGAAGVYSDIGAFRGYIRDGYNGLLSPNDPAAWVERICLLLADESIRAEVYRNALADCEAHASDPGFRLR